MSDYTFVLSKKRGTSQGLEQDNNNICVKRGY